MSSALGKVRFLDGTIMYFRYNGTSDVCNKRLFPLYDDLRENWRREADVDDIDFVYERVEIANNYASGYWWSGLASRSGAIHDDSLIPNDYTLVDNGKESEPRNIENEGLPYWWGYDD